MLLGPLSFALWEESDVQMSFLVKVIGIFEEKRSEAFLLFDGVEERMNGVDHALIRKRLDGKCPDTPTAPKKLQNNWSCCYEQVKCESSSSYSSTANLQASLMM